MGFRTIGLLVVGVSVSAASAVTTIGTGSFVQGAIISYRDIGQTFRTLANANRSLDSFSVRANAENFNTGAPNVSATMRLAVFRFNGSSVVGNALYTSAPRAVPVGAQLMTFQPRVLLEPDTTYLAVFDKWTLTPNATAAVRFFANTFSGASDAYPAGQIRTSGLNAYPYTGATWGTSSGAANDTSDLFFEAVFNVPEPASMLLIGAASLACRRRRSMRSANCR